MKTSGEKGQNLDGQIERSLGLQRDIQSGVIDKTRFLLEHKDEIIPLLDEREKAIMDRIQRDEDVSPQEVGELRRKYETRVYEFVKEKSDPCAKRVMLEASEPLAFNNVAPLMERMRSDPRCAGFTLLTDNYAGREIEKDERDRFSFLKEIKRGGLPVIADIQGDYDVGLFLVEGANSSSSLVAFAGKNVFGAKKLFGFVTGWAGVGEKDSPFARSVNSAEIKVDAILCNDDLSRRIIESQLPNFPPENIIVCGSPVIDSLDFKRAKQYRTEGRAKLGIGENDFTVLYFGDISSYYPKAGYEVDEKVNEKTFVNLLEDFSKVAEEFPDKQFVLAVRPHPRDPDQAQLQELIKRNTRGNLKVVWASGENVSIHEARYLADGFASICSTENFIGPLIGRQSIFLGYGDRMGSVIYEKIYTEKLLEIIKSQPGLAVADSSDAVRQCLSKFFKDIEQNKELEVSLPPASSTERILDILLEDKK